MSASSLPIFTVLPDLLVALETRGRAVLQAPPGAGKTTGVPPALLSADWRGDGKIILLEPRRIAARAAARRMAQQLGEAVGETVGYRVRFDSKVGPKTRIEVVTEGVLLRLLQADPELSGVAAVIFDEFHERALDADLGLALSWECRTGLREDLRILVMSATLDAGPVASLLDDAPLITSEGRAYPVETRYLPQDSKQALPLRVATAVKTALSEEQGSILAFLPGQGEIRKCLPQLKDLPSTVDLVPLYGGLDGKVQDAAIKPAPAGRRKVVLATAIAETSLTINGVRVVIDGGEQRRPTFDPRSGMTRLITETVCRAAADQRRGRAGREAPGICYRLWTEASDRALIGFAPPEIADADLAPLLLELAQWGTVAEDLPWLDAPPPAHLEQAADLLRLLGALDGDHRITPTGTQMSQLPVHPRLAHMLLKAQALGMGALGCLLAALLEERDPAGTAGVDLRERVRLAASGDGRYGQVRDAAKQLRRKLKISGDVLSEIDGTGLLLAFAYPDRIAERRPGGQARFRLSNGKGAWLPEEDMLAASPFLATADLDGKAREARIYRAASLSRSELEEHFADQIVAAEDVWWDAKAGRVEARWRRRLGAVVLETRKLPNPDPAEVAAALTEGLRRKGLHALPWQKADERLRQRLAFLHAQDEQSGWPNTDDRALLESLEEWLTPHLSGLRKLEDLSKLDMSAILTAGLSWEQRQALDRLAPSHWVVPSGARHAIDYNGGRPVLPVKLQEMFGSRESPRILDGQVAITVHLLSPAGRPLQVTQDLQGFWRTGYGAVKSEMKGRYPKHPWPDDPMAAVPTARTNRRR